MLLWLHNLDFAGGGDPSLGPTKGGRVRKKRRIVVDVDGELFEVGSIQEAEAVLLQLRELAQRSAELAVTQAVSIPKPPRVRVLGPAGKPTTSPVLQRAVRQTQRAITKAYVDRSRSLRIIEDEEIAITLLL